MSRRKTVSLALNVVCPLIKKHCRSNTVFCEKMDRAPNWVTEWNRKGPDGNPAPKNLPSPEEAARMCLILDTTPDVILTKPEDIVLVSELLEAQKKPALQTESELLSPAKQRIMDLLDDLTDAQLERLAGIIEEAKKLV